MIRYRFVTIVDLIRVQLNVTENWSNRAAYVYRNPLNVSPCYAIEKNLKYDPVPRDLHIQYLNTFILI